MPRRGKPRQAIRPLTLDTLREFLSYNPDTGVWTWNSARRWSRAGTVAGTITGLGYVNIWIHGRAYGASRLAWLWMTGEWPKEDVDHIDCNPNNNAWSNLRAATRGQNKSNSRVYRCNSLGLKGVKQRSYGYEVIVTKDRKQHYGGVYPTAEEAKAARDRLAKELHGEFFHP